MYKKNSHCLQKVETFSQNIKIILELCSKTDFLSLRNFKKYLVTNSSSYIHIYICLYIYIYNKEKKPKNVKYDLKMCICKISEWGVDDELENQFYLILLFFFVLFLFVLLLAGALRFFFYLLRSATSSARSSCFCSSSL